MKRLGAIPAAALLVLLLSSSTALAVDAPIAVTVADWTSSDGHAFVGVQANGQWATPSSSGYCSVWQLKAVVAPNEWVYWVWVYQNGCSGQAVNFTNPAQVVTTPGQPGMGIHANTSAGMSLYLQVSVNPQDAPAESQRTVSAQLTAGWLTALNGAIQAYVVPSSVRVTTWTVRFGDDSIKSFSASSTLSSSPMSLARPTARSSRQTGPPMSSSSPSRSTSATARAGSGRRSNTSRPS
jgi:hypothetical protein